MNTKFLTMCCCKFFYAILFVYFKNVVSKVDEKLNLMYELIQTHANENEIQFMKICELFHNQLIMTFK